MQIEVIFKDRIGPYRRGQIVELEDGVFLRAAIRGGKAEVLNPPDWEPAKEEPEGVYFDLDNEEVEPVTTDEVFVEPKRSQKKKSESIEIIENGNDVERHDENGYEEV